MIERTDEMVDAVDDAWMDGKAADEAVSAVLAIVERDYNVSRRSTAEERRACCGDARESIRLGEELLHTSTCERRCAIDVPIIYPRGHPGTYPCARTAGHGTKEHWIPEGYLRRTDSETNRPGGES